VRLTMSVSVVSNGCTEQIVVGEGTQCASLQSAVRTKLACRCGCECTKRLYLRQNKYNEMDRSQHEAIHTDVGNEVTGRSSSSSLSGNSSSSSECAVNMTRIKKCDYVLDLDVHGAGCLAFFNFWSSFRSCSISRSLAFSSTKWPHQ
jgi:hypothetical protein